MRSTTPSRSALSSTFLLRTTSALSFFFVPILIFGPRLSFRKRIFAGFSVQMCVVLAMPIMMKLVDLVANQGEAASEDTYSLRTAILFVLLVMLAVVGAMAGLLASSLLGLAALFPPRYTQAVQQGAGLSAVILSVLRIITLLAIPATVEGAQQNGILYFSLTAVAGATCLLLFFLLQRHPFYRVQTTSSTENAGESTSLTRAGSEDVREHMHNPSTPRPRGASAGDFNEVEAMVGSRIRRESEAGLSSIASLPQVHGAKLLKWCFKRSYSALLLVFSSYFILTLVFPGVVTVTPFPNSINLANANVSRTDFVWYQVGLVGCWNVFDYIGRAIPLIGVVARRLSLRSMWATIPITVVSAVLIALAATPSMRAMAVFFRSVFVPFVACAICGGLGGVQLAFGAIAAPLCVPSIDELLRDRRVREGMGQRYQEGMSEREKGLLFLPPGSVENLDRAKEVTGILTSLAINVGLVLGSYIALPLAHLVQAAHTA
mmetsp:Transcript_41455/g.107409  ORF Transcript_41455/g.107409 Transcript_41455/m.107409 type:complete len:490 (-) Transcript_41455:288-1757(-)